MEVQKLRLLPRLLIAVMILAALASGEAVAHEPESRITTTTTTQQNQSADTTANARGNAIISATAALIGALVGGSVTLLAGYMTWKRERKAYQEQVQRENRTRFHDAKRTVYATFLGHFVQILPKARRVTDLTSERQKAEAAGTPPGSSENLRQALKDLVQHEQELYALRAEVWFIASGQVREVVDRLWDLQFNAYKGAVESSTAINWSGVESQLSTEVEQLVKAARTEFET